MQPTCVEDYGPRNYWQILFRRSQGAYDPVISDGKHLYLTGNHSLTALRPLQNHGEAARKRAARKRRR